MEDFDTVDANSGIANSAKVKIMEIKMRIILTFGILLTGVAFGAFGYEGQKWEYKCVEPLQAHKDVVDDVGMMEYKSFCKDKCSVGAIVEKKLNEFGSEGWEWINYDLKNVRSPGTTASRPLDVLCFKRKKV